MTTEWLSWDIDEWGSALLRHFFARTPSVDGLVVDTLLVTAEELASATGDGLAEPEVVRSAFIRSVLAGIGSGSVMDHACSVPWSPEVPDKEPKIVPHLMFACLAASESTEDFADEASFIRRLDKLAAGRFGRLEEMPYHWRRLKSWLESGSNPRRFRQLRLPDPGHLTRIGYTVGLAFPDRRDQQSLADLLARRALNLESPPLGKTVTLVSENRSIFRPRFQQALDEFRSLIGTSDTERLRRHRFWCAVLAAARRGRISEPTHSSSLVRQVLAWETDGTVSFCAVTVRDETIPGFRTISLPYAYGDYSAAIVPGDSVTLDDEAATRGVAAVISGALRISAVSQFIRGGLIPFGADEGSQMSCLAWEDLELTTVALVRNELSSSIVSKFAGKAQRSPFEGWEIVTGCKLMRLPSVELSGGPLDDCWLLHETVERPRLRLAGGIRTEDGWLGHSKILPSVRFGRSSEFPLEVVLEGESRRDPLLRCGDEWKIPPRNLSGLYTLTAIDRDEVVDVRTVRFHAFAVSDSYKQMAQPNIWLQEAIAGSITCDLAGNGSSIPVDATAWTRPTVYLCSDVGHFTVNESEATWVASRDHGTIKVERRSKLEPPTPPVAQSRDKGANRKWRKYLSSHPSESDPELPAAKRTVWSVVNSHLPEADFVPVDYSLDYEPRVATPHTALDEFVDIVAARSRETTGVAPLEFADLAKAVLALTPTDLGLMVRSWTESAILDLASLSRWNCERYFLRRPEFVGYQIGSRTVASLTGLVPRVVREEIWAAAQRAHLSPRQKGALGGLTPRTITVEAQHPSDLERFSHSLRVPLTWLRAPSASDSKTWGTIERGKPIPGGYPWSREVRDWSIGKPDKDLPPLVLKFRSDAPAVWTTQGGEWSHSLNVCRLIASYERKIDVWSQVGSNELEAITAFIPLPFARTVATLAPALPGAADARGYRYSFGTPTFRRFVITQVDECFR